MRLISLMLILAVVVGCNSKDGAASKRADSIFKYNLGQQPTTMNPLSSTDAYSSRVQAYVIESLAERDDDTYDWKPALSTKFEIAPNGLEYTFTLREGVKWHDGKPFTAEDVKFSFDAIMDKDNKYKTAHLKSYFENIESCEIVSPNVVKFKAKSKYFGNFDVVAGMDIVPRHLYENPSKDQEKKLNKTLVGTGPYIFDKFTKGKSIILKKNSNWWGNSAPSQKGMHQFEAILMRFIKDGTIAIQRMEREDLDFIALNAEEYVKKTSSKNWGEKVFKVKTQNQAPKGYGFIGWNMKSDIFKSRDVRLALYKLINRPLMIKKFDFDMNLPATGPWYQQSVYADPNVKPVMYDPKSALDILRKDGWKDTDGDRILDKKINGKKVKLSFTILEPNKEFIKYLTIFKEDAKKAGVDVNIKQVEWNTFIKKLDERSFDAVRLAWSGGSVDIDPKQIWHSASYANQGSNFIGYENKKVDKLIDQARETLDKQARIKKLQEVYREIANDVPYAFLFNSQYAFYGHTKHTKRPKDTFKYSVGLNHWWIEK
ncbi:ABC transporter substrate-binding protein [Bacteriovoracaceae bacterium]|nr:ABC transporter substrate-binding protein [Bacteriovoracaceae bacterium]